MRTFKIIVSGAVLSLFVTVMLHAAEPVAWKLDKMHTTVGFSVKHLGISKVRGTFSGFDAEIKADPMTGKLSSLSAAVDVATVDTGIEARDNHLKAEDFFYAEKFKQMKLVSKSIVFKGDKVTIKTDLTIRGVTLPVTFEGEYLGSNKVNVGQGDTMRAGYSVSAKIDRKKFGLSFGSIVDGVAAVGDMVTIQLDAEIYRSL